MKQLDDFPGFPGSRPPTFFIVSPKVEQIAVIGQVNVLCCFIF